MWAFPDKKGRPCCLIPEATALFQERCKDLLGRRQERLLFYQSRGAIGMSGRKPAAIASFHSWGSNTWARIRDRPPNAVRKSPWAFSIRWGFGMSSMTRAKRGLSYYLGGQDSKSAAPNSAPSNRSWEAARIAKARDSR